jgi:chromatin assembly factor 1 subunit B
MISSTDGYCSFVTFQPGELGEEYKPSEGNEKQVTPSRAKESGGVPPVSDTKTPTVTPPGPVAGVVPSGNDAEQPSGSPKNVAEQKVDVVGKVEEKCEPMEVDAEPQAKEEPPQQAPAPEVSKPAEKAPFVIRARSAKQGLVLSIKACIIR